jgi:excisionase family DNA binding protein
MDSTNPIPPQLLNLDEASERLRLSRRGVERLIASGSLRTVTIGRRRLVDERDLRSFINSLKLDA